MLHLGVQLFFLLTVVLVSIYLLDVVSLDRCSFIIACDNQRMVENKWRRYARHRHLMYNQHVGYKLRAMCLVCYVTDCCLYLGYCYFLPFSCFLPLPFCHCFHRKSRYDVSSYTREDGGLRCKTCEKVKFSSTGVTVQPPLLLLC